MIVGNLEFLSQRLGGIDRDIRTAKPFSKLQAANTLVDIKDEVSRAETQDLWP